MIKLILARDQVIAHILNNEGTDPENSEFVFHFRTYQALSRCRDSMYENIPAAFHNPPTLVNILNQQYGLNIPPPIPMAEAWLVLKTAVLETDYRQDQRFFLIY